MFLISNFVCLPFSWLYLLIFLYSFFLLLEILYHSLFTNYVVRHVCVCACTHAPPTRAYPYTCVHACRGQRTISRVVSQICLYLLSAGITKCTIIPRYFTRVLGMVILLWDLTSPTELSPYLPILVFSTFFCINFYIYIFHVLTMILLTSLGSNFFIGVELN